MGWIRRFALVAVVSVFAGFAVAPANAAGKIGQEETIRHLQDVEVKGAQGEKLYLGYMTRTWNLFAGVWLEDAGYVLGVAGDSRAYYELVPDELKRFQAAGLLPDPLPPYRLDALDYVGGYLLWWVMLASGLWMLGRKAFRRVFTGPASNSTAANSSAA
jgi:hypothetical protein